MNVDKNCKPKQDCKIFKVCKRVVTEMKEMPCKKPPVCPKPKKTCCAPQSQQVMFG